VYNGQSAGFYYDSPQRKKCSRCHLCIVSSKCQNYNPHLLKCKSCELRVVEALNKPASGFPIKGYPFESDHRKDIQEAHNFMENLRKRAPNNQGTGQYVEEIGWAIDKQLRLAEALETMKQQEEVGELEVINELGSY